MWFLKWIPALQITGMTNIGKEFAMNNQGHDFVVVNEIY